MDRPPSPHPKKLATILEQYESKTFVNSNNNYTLSMILAELKEIKEDIKEIKNKLI